MSSIHDAIVAGDVGAVACILDADPSQLEARNELGDAPIHTAAQQLQKEIVGLLINRGADVNAIGNQGYTPLHYASQEDKQDLVEILIRHGADLERRDNQGYSPLQWACRASPQIAQVLLQHGANIDLNIAIHLRDSERVRQLLKTKSGLKAVAAFPDMLVEDALLARSKEVFDLLLAHKKHPNPLELARPSSLLFSAIQQAMSDRDLTYLGELLGRGASVDVTNGFGDSPLDFIKKFSAAGAANASRAKVKQEIIRMFTEQGAGG